MRIAKHLAVCECGYVAKNIHDFNFHSWYVRHKWVEVPDVVVVMYPGYKKPPRKKYKRQYICVRCTAPYDCKAFKRCDKRGN